MLKYVNGVLTAERPLHKEHERVLGVHEDEVIGVYMYLHVYVWM
jgi:hypothetical protein